jgi:hypothetical protein
MTTSANGQHASQGDLRPIDPSTGTPQPERRQPGYYPGFSTLSQQAFWDEATRRTVLERVDAPPPIRFFSDEELRLIEAVIARLIPQDDRVEGTRIPVINSIDERLYSGRIDGYRYEDMPPDREAYRLGLQGIDLSSRHMFDRSFCELSPTEQDELLWTLHAGEPQGGEEVWDQLPVDRFWLLIAGDAFDAYYSHPFAWDEIGFGGPSYPRGYFRLEGGKPEPWEVEERRYEWAPPPTSTSGQFKQLGGRHPHRAPAGQEGTH